MNIPPNNQGLKSAGRSDPDSPSFRPPQRQFPGGPKRQPSNGQGDNVVQIHPRSQSQHTEAIASLEHAISYIQTQQGFLDRAREALSRMSQPDTPDDPLSAHENRPSPEQVSQVEDYLRSLASKTFDGVPLFGSGEKQATPSLSAISSVALIAGIQLTPLDLNLGDGKTGPTVETALDHFARLRERAGENLSRMEATLEKLVRETPSALPDSGSARDNMESARSSILAQSEEALVAQANLVPESALRLLD